MRILYIIPNLRKGGAERLVLDMCIELATREGVVIKLITFSDENEYRFLTQNVDWEVVPSSVQLSLTGKNKYSVDNLQKNIDSFKPDIIHTHLFEAELVSRCCSYPQAKWFSHGHDNMPQFRNFSFRTLFNKRFFTDYYEKRVLFNRYKVNGGNHFIAISKDVWRYFEHTARCYPVTLLPNAINYSLFYKPKEKSENTAALRLVNVGSLVDKKNQMFLIEVVKVLRLRNIDVELNLLGNGKNKVALQQKVLENKLENRVIFHGIVNNVEEHLWRADIYVHSATYEPLGLVLIEAMAAGLPVITLDGKGNRDLIEEGKNGFMLCTQNAAVFADNIMELWANQEKYWEMTKYAQEYAKKYDINEYVNNLLNLYQQALNGKKED
jgi:glycosyltransferase involved in cell wall biosynthesis